MPNKQQRMEEDWHRNEMAKQSDMVQTGRSQKLLVQIMNLLQQSGINTKVSIVWNSTLTARSMYGRLIFDGDRAHYSGVDAAMTALTQVESPVHHLVIKLHDWIWGLADKSQQKQFDSTAAVFGKLSHLSLSLDDDDDTVSGDDVRKVSSLLIKMARVKSLHLNGYTNGLCYGESTETLVAEVLNGDYNALEDLTLDDFVFDLDSLCDFIKRCKSLQKIQVRHCHAVVSAAALGTMTDEHNLDPYANSTHAVTSYVGHVTGMTSIEFDDCRMVRRKANAYGEAAYEVCGWDKREDQLEFHTWVDGLPDNELNFLESDNHSGEDGTEERSDEDA
jgi:hypothetical protein